MKILVAFISIFLLSETQVYSSEIIVDSWFKKEWLIDPTPAESRPSWWYDLRGRGGAVLVVKVVESSNKQNAFEITTVSLDDQDSKIQLDEHIFEIKNILSISHSMKQDDTSFSENSKIQICTSKKYDFARERWRSSVALPEDKIFIAYVESVGLALPGKYVIQWTMDINKLDGIKRILNNKF